MATVARPSSSGGVGRPAEVRDAGRRPPRTCGGRSRSRWTASWDSAAAWRGSASRTHSGRSAITIELSKRPAWHAPVLNSSVRRPPPASLRVDQGGRRPEAGPARAARVDDLAQRAEVRGVQVRVGDRHRREAVAAELREGDVEQHRGRASRVSPTPCPGTPRRTAPRCRAARASRPRTSWPRRVSRSAPARGHRLRDHDVGGQRQVRPVGLDRTPPEATPIAHAPGRAPRSPSTGAPPSAARACEDASR